MPRHLIVVATEAVPTEDVDSVVRAHTGGGVDVQVHVIAPESRIHWLDWLTNIDGPVGAEAAQRADEAASALSTAVNLDAGDVDPLQAVEDALRLYPADELLIVTASDEEATWIESDLKTVVHERFGLPITHLVAGSGVES